MSRVRNADQFGQAFGRIKDDYDRIFAPTIASIRAEYADTAGKGGRIPIDDSLEAHLRVFLVNSFLAALNWRPNFTPEDGLPNLIPEVPLRSTASGTTRFLDYLGIECESNHPLLIVETKRPSSGLPRTVAGRKCATFEEVISSGLSGGALSGEWSEWLQTLKDYVCSVHSATNTYPRRVVITNGDWLIVFLDVADSFSAKGTRNPVNILVFQNSEDIKARAAVVYGVLEYNLVSNILEGILPSELPFHISSEDVIQIMHGLHLRYIEQTGIYGTSPIIKLAPIILIRSRWGSWLRIEEPPREYELPHDRERLGSHILEVKAAAIELNQKVIEHVGRNMPALSLREYYADGDSFQEMPAVIERQPNEYFVITGSSFHYLLFEPTIQGCPYHNSDVSQAGGVLASPNILARSINPRSFFFSGEVHHCTHRDVSAIKASRITAENRMRCGPRSGQDHQAFCEIWRLETRLCCRACVFGGGCDEAEVFNLPCIQ